MKTNFSCHLIWCCHSCPLRPSSKTTRTQRTSHTPWYHQPNPQNNTNQHDDETNHDHGEQQSKTHHPLIMTREREEEPSLPTSPPTSTSAMTTTLTMLAELLMTRVKQWDWETMQHRGRLEPNFEFCQWYTTLTNTHLWSWISPLPRPKHTSSSWIMLTLISEAPTNLKQAPSLAWTTNSINLKDLPIHHSRLNFHLIWKSELLQYPDIPPTASITTQQNTSNTSVDDLLLHLT